MKKKIFIMIAITILVILAFAATAMAQQSPCGAVTYSLMPNSGAAGTTVAVSGSGMLSTDPFSLYWESISGELLASGTSTAGGDFNANITIPSGATVGAHTVLFSGADETEQNVECPQTFTVVAATADTGVQPDAYTAAAARTSLPSTGIFLLPAAGLLAAGAGLMMKRKRS